MDDKELTLADMKKKSDKKIIDANEANKISENAKREIKAKEVSEATKKEKDEILALVDDRIERLAEENKTINVLREQAIQEKMTKESENITTSSEVEDYEIPDDDYLIVEEDIDMSNDTELHVYNDQQENSEFETPKHNTKSSIDLEEDNKEDILNIVYNNEESNQEEQIEPEVKLPLPVTIVDKSNDHTVMKSGNKLTEEDNKSIQIDDNDFKELNEDYKTETNESKDYIELPESNESSESSSKEEKDLVFSQEELEQAFEEMRSNLTKILHPIKNSIDISQFKVGSPININNAAPTRHKDVAEHVLWNSKRTISFEELEGFEVNELAAPLEQGVSEYSQTLRKLTILYDHIKSKKPADVITWAKTTRDDDLDHVYGSAYIGSFKNSNIFISQCEKCQSPYISQDIPIMNMMKFKDDTIKNQYFDLLNNPDDSPYKIEGKGYQISDDYLMKIKVPSVWKTRLEPLLLDPQFREKYRSIINILTYIDTIYYIDREKFEYRPIDFSSDFKKDEPNRARKVLMNKIKKYGAIISKALSPNEFQKMWMCINKEIKSNENDDITYIIPKRTCVKCNHVDEEVILTAEDLLFTRHQLAQLASI